MNNVVDEVKRAYAVLGLPPGSWLGQVRRRYKVLVKRWHPDRYATDPVSQEEASNRMREINVAYRRLVRHLAPGNTRRQAEPPAASRAPAKERLSREEIERLVRAIGSEGPVENLLGMVGCVGRTIQGVLAMVLVAACIGRAATWIVRGDLGGLLTDPHLILFLACLTLLAVHEYRGRRRLERGQ